MPLFHITFSVLPKSDTSKIQRFTDLYGLLYRLFRSLSAQLAGLGEVPQARSRKHSCYQMCDVINVYGCHMQQTILTHIDTRLRTNTYIDIYSHIWYYMTKGGENNDR